MPVEAVPTAKPMEGSKDAAKDAAKETAKDAPRKTTPIAIFVSRKEKKIYVRQNFEPLFEAPVTIGIPMRRWGRMSSRRWISCPTTRRCAGTPSRCRLNRRHRSRHTTTTMRRGPASMRGPAIAARIVLSPAAIRRRRRRPNKRWPASKFRRMPSISFPPVDRPGSSLIVSDHGLGDETGEGTDFIVVMR